MARPPQKINDSSYNVFMSLTDILAATCRGKLFTFIFVLYSITIALNCCKTRISGELICMAIIVLIEEY